MAEALECLAVHPKDGQEEIQYYGLDETGRKCRVGRLGFSRMEDLPPSGVIRTGGEWYSRHPFMLVPEGAAQPVPPPQDPPMEPGPLCEPHQAPSAKEKAGQMLTQALEFVRDNNLVLTPVRDGLNYTFKIEER